MKLSVVPIGMIFALILFTAGCPGPAPPPVSPAPTTTAANTPPLQARFDLGVLTQRDSIRFNGWIKNQGDREVEVTTFKTSCDCLTVELDPLIIPPRGRALAKLHYDGAKEPDFVGSLLITVDLVDAEGTTVGTIEAPIEVIAGKETPIESKPNVPLVPTPVKESP